MRSAARPILAMALVTVLLGAALYTMRGLRQVDPRARASWSGAAPTLDGSPRDVTLFVPACDARAVVLRTATSGHQTVAAEFFTAAPDGTMVPSGSASVAPASGSSIALPLDVPPPWRAPMVVRLSHHGGALPLDPRQPIALDLTRSTPLGSIGCAIDGAPLAASVLLLVAVLAIIAVAAELGKSWLGRALGLLDERVSGRDATLVALGAVAATLATYMLLVPPFEPPDELAHYQYARFVAVTGTLPRAVPPVGSEWRDASYEFVQQPLYYAGAAAVLKAARLDSPGPELVPNPRSRLRPGGTEPTIFQHGPRPAQSTGHRGVVLLRLASAAMALLTAWIIARLVMTVTTDPLVVVTIVGGLGLIPQWCAVMGAVSTDPPATLLAAASTLAIVRVALGRTDTTWLLATGLAIGAAYAVKATTVFLVPMALLACIAEALTRNAHDRNPRRREVRSLAQRLTLSLRAVSVIGAGIVLAAGWIPVRAWLVFGDPSARAFKRAVLEAGGFVPVPGPMPWTAEFWSQMQTMVFESFWARFGSLGAGPFPGSKVWFIYAVASAWLAGLICWVAVVRPLDIADARRRRSIATDSARPDDVLAVVVCGVGLALGLGAWIAVNLIPQADMVVHWTPRHILPLTAPAALLAAAGLERVRHASSMARRSLSACTGLVVIALALAWLIVLRDTTLMFHFGF